MTDHRDELARVAVPEGRTPEAWVEFFSVCARDAADALLDGTASAFQQWADALLSDPEDAPETEAEEEEPKGMPMFPAHPPELVAETADGHLILVSCSICKHSEVSANYPGYLRCKMGAPIRLPSHPVCMLQFESRLPPEVMDGPQILMNGRVYKRSDPPTEGELDPETWLQRVESHLLVSPVDEYTLSMFEDGLKLIRALACEKAEAEEERDRYHAVWRDAENRRVDEKQRAEAAEADREGVARERDTALEQLVELAGKLKAAEAKPSPQDAPAEGECPHWRESYPDPCPLVGMPCVGIAGQAGQSSRRQCKLRALAREKAEAEKAAEQWSGQYVRRGRQVTALEQRAEAATLDAQTMETQLAEARAEIAALRLVPMVKVPILDDEDPMAPEMWAVIVRRGANAIRESLPIWANALDGLAAALDSAAPLGDAVVRGPLPEVPATYSSWAHWCIAMGAANGPTLARWLEDKPEEGDDDETH